MYEVRFSVGVQADLEAISPYYRQRLLDAVKRQLVSEPTSATRHRKILINLNPPWQTIPPVWELRVGEYRVFYDVDETSHIVFIRAIRHKPPGKRTEEIL